MQAECVLLTPGKAEGVALLNNEIVLEIWNFNGLNQYKDCL